MKIPTLLTLIFGAFTALGQFEIDSFEQFDQFNMGSKFPIVRSADNPVAADKINIVLHHRMLEKIYREDDDNRYEKVIPAEGEFHGASEFDYEILANNERFFSVAITSAYTGAYSEYYTHYFNFDTKSGQPIVLSELFSESSINDLSEWVTSSIHTQIIEFMNQIDVNDEDGYGQEQYEMYEECAAWYVETQTLSNENFYLTDSTITFVKGRCSNHMMMALDDLWEFHEVYSLDELYKMMSDSGVSLLDGNGLKFNDITIPHGKVLKGTIGGKYPITMIVTNTYKENYSGVYWYDKIKKPIELSGKVDDAAYLQLTETVNDKVTGEMSLQVILGGTLQGDWHNAEGSKKLDISLSLKD